MKRIIDLALELRISFARHLLMRNPTKANYYRMANLCQSRSMDQIQRMERQRGLA